MNNQKHYPNPQGLPLQELVNQAEGFFEKEDYGAALYYSNYAFNKADFIMELHGKYTKTSTMDIMRREYSRAASLIQESRRIIGPITLANTRHHGTLHFLQDTYGRINIVPLPLSITPPRELMI